MKMHYHSLFSYGRGVQMKRLMLLVLALMLTACGKGGANSYLGYWQMQKTSLVVVMEIKQEGGNYFAKDDIFSNDGHQSVLSEKNGELVLDTGMGTMPFKLSDDGKSLFFGNHSYRKIDEATKDQLVAQQESCRKLSDEYRESFKSLPPLFPSEPYDKAKYELDRRFSEQFATLEKNANCNSKPIGLK